MKDESYLLCALLLVPGIGNSNARTLIHYFGSVEKLFSASKDELLTIPDMGLKTINALLEKRPFEEADAILAKCKIHDITPIPYFHINYPYRLKELKDSPVLFI
ncbi:MAG: hypothetical protein HQ474_13255 [Flammeovirgaceae bacterium]|jgi:DNA processing protein|nr:hypothetical protein [Flammeovirgaceae bacterium]|tara:strand:+ start:496 stop:807 length:312 start_codon:yes stop_codon:yes gene_type:complete